MKKPKSPSKAALLSDAAPATSAAPAATPADAPPAAKTSGKALRLNAGKGAAKLSTAQQRFNRLLAKIDKLESQVTEMQTLGDAFRPLYDSTLAPLRQTQTAMMRRMALLLDERLQRKGLTPAQKRDTLEILCNLCEALAIKGDAEMAALHDQHSPHTLRQKEEEQAAGLRAMMEDALGQSLNVDAQDGSLNPMEALFRASQEGLNAAMQAEEEREAAAQARKKKKPSPAQHKAAQEQEDADSVLRQVYRQLASALHPDRERDPAEQQRKTALMSEANAAYAKQDLMALLHLQLRIAQADAQDLLQQPEERIAAMTRLLKQQAAELESELMARQHHLQQEFELEFYQMPSAATLRRQLEEQEKYLKDELGFMEEDLAQVQDDAGFKRWLKAQIKMSKRVEFDASGFF
ncbi:MAG: hypothetical protein NTZ64_02635 [Polaromonas sp.]|nr:hypothetical protein [Polaromonas sp.]